LTPIPSFFDLLEKQKADGNKWALRVNDKKDVVMGRALLKANLKANELAEKILILLDRYEDQKENISKIEGDIYNYSGEWGLDNFYSVHKFDYTNQLESDVL